MTKGSRVVLMLLCKQHVNLACSKAIHNYATILPVYLVVNSNSQVIAMHEGIIQVAVADLGGVRGVQMYPPFGG